MKDFSKFIAPLTQSEWISYLMYRKPRPRWFVGWLFFRIFFLFSNSFSWRFLYEENYFKMLHLIHYNSFVNFGRTWYIVLKFFRNSCNFNAFNIIHFNLLLSTSEEKKRMKCIFCEHKQTTDIQHRQVIANFWAATTHDEVKTGTVTVVISPTM